MQSPDFEGIEGCLEKDPSLRKLYDEHKRLKRQVAKLEKKLHLTPSEAGEQRDLKKLKLANKDLILKRLARCLHG